MTNDHVPSGCGRFTAHVPRPWSLVGANGETIYGDAHEPAGEPRGVVLLCHGFKGYKDYGFFPWLAGQCAAAGFIAHRFNFSHSGMTNRIETFERPDLFERDTWGGQVHDLLTVARSLRSGAIAGGDLPMTWFGHSRGGVTALLAAARAERAIAPARVVVAAAPFLACNLVDDQKAMLREQGYLESPSSRTGQRLRVGRVWLDEVEANPQAFDPCRAIGAIGCPVLVIHGTGDTTVPPQAAKTLRDARGAKVSVAMIAGASHTFDAPNPMAMDAMDAPAATAEMARLVVGFAGER